MLNSFLAKLYLIIGSFLCVMFVVGVLSGWKLPTGSFNSSGRSSGGFWGMGK